MPTMGTVMAIKTGSRRPRHPFYNRHFEAIVYLVCQEYELWRRLQEPGYQLDPRRPGPGLWGDLVCDLLDAGSNPIKYVEFWFTTGEYRPWPATLASGFCRRWYRAVAAQESASTLGPEYYIQRFEDIHNRNPEKSVESILKDRRNSFKETFVWCMARRHGLSGIQREQYRRALTQLCNASELSIYTKHFPRELAS